MTHRGQTNLQDAFLNRARKECVPVTVYLTNGVQLKGIIQGFDNFTVVLEADGVQDLVYKHAVATVVPERPVAFAPDEHHQDRGSAGTNDTLRRKS